MYRSVKIHFIRDLSGWAPQQGAAWEPEKEELLQSFCRSLFHEDGEEVFLIAGNDGQVIESFRRLQETDYVKRARQAFEELLIEDRSEQSGVRLKFFNLSRASSAELFDRIRVSNPVYAVSVGSARMGACKADHRVARTRAPLTGPRSSPLSRPAD